MASAKNITNASRSDQRVVEAGGLIRSERLYPGRQTALQLKTALFK